MNLAVCAIFKNEALYLAEWITFHRLAGVERFYLYDHDSDDDWQETLAPEIREGVVTIIPWSEPQYLGGAAPGGAQGNAYKDCLKRFRGEARWLAFLDLDEFLFSPTGRALPEVLQRYSAHPGVIVNWFVYGPGGWDKKPPGLVIESYLLRARSDHPAYRSYKPIVSPRQTINWITSIHSFTHYSPGKFFGEGHAVCEDGRPFRPGHDFCPGGGEFLRINHYYTKSIEEARQKHNRHLDWVGGVELSYLLNEDLNEVRDGTILQFVPELKMRLAARAVLADTSSGASTPRA